MANTCREAVEEAFAGENGVLDTAQVIDRIYKRYPDRPWKPNAISAHLIGLSVNHSSSIHHPTLRKHGLLFILGIWSVPTMGPCPRRPVGRSRGVFYDVTEATVQIRAIVAKSLANEWLERCGEKP